MDTIITAILLGIVEGLTEFLPVSSTGHLILASELFGYDAKTWEVFNVVIQLPAVMAVVVLYWRTFATVTVGALRGSRESIAFIRNVLAAFVPAAIVGVLFKSRIDLLLENPMVVCVALIVGGFVIIVVERLVRHQDYRPVGRMPLGQAIGIGMMQCIAVIPGISRSGATIMGALTLGENRRTAAEFSFFLAVPTMLGATVKQLWDHRHELAVGAGQVGWQEIAIGSVVSFVVSLIVIRFFIDYVSRQGFTPFAVYRIVLGSAVLAWLLWA
ncbi:MAG: undecaprenyl-diphosphate phosphatase [Novosphingobium sp.]|jgi:undecaprenyl-diphosphatase|uniref:undecaprenyl-diphosphate phosphatase n=1 Tax=Novosphingobium sp. TaxID=1874826 RepID=UPI003018B030